MLKKQKAVAGLIFVVAAVGSSAAISQAKLTTIGAGQWEIVRHYELTANGPDHPANPPSDSSSLCLSGEYAEGDILTDYLRGGPGEISGCSFAIKSAAGGRLEMVRQCDSDDFAQTINYIGTYDSTSFEVIESEAQTIKDGGGEYTRRDRIVGRRSSASCS